jgi:hypothetical protein
LIVQRITLAVVAIAALAASAAIVVFAAAFALYALLRDILTPAGAAAAVCLGAAIVAALAALIAAQQAKGPLLRKRPPSSSRDYRPPDNLIARAIDVARDRPFVAAGAAVAAGLLAVANPALVTAVMRAFIDPGRPPRR